MDAVIVAALVAGFVSFIGVIANIYIARQAKRAAMLQPKVQAMISRTSEADSLLKNYVAEIERLRIRCWNLLGHLNEIQRKGDRETIYTNLKNIVPEFVESVNVFENAWAPVKGEMPLGILYYIREVRHGCRANLGAIINYMHTALYVLEDQSKAEDLDELMKMFNASESQLKDALKKLDDLISLIRAVRENIGEELQVDLSAEPNNSFNRTRR